MPDFNTSRLKKNPLFDSSRLKRNPMAPKPDVPEPPSFTWDELAEGYSSAYRSPDDPGINDDLVKAVYPIVKPFLEMGYTSAAAFNRGMSTFSTHLDLLGDYINEKTGGRLTKGGVFEEAAKVYDENAK
jgi:hypothetical protein